MKKILMALIATSLLIACSDNKTINGVEYETYGLISKDDVKADSVKYEVCWGNVIWGAFLVETVIAPIYFFGFDMWEPVAKK
jgi:hypothetical protein